MMDNNNNMMELNTEETQKKKERKEKFENFKKKIKGLKDKLKESKEDKQREKEEKARVKAEEAQEKSNDVFHSLGEQTVTNETIQKETKPQRTLSPQEERMRKRKRKKMIQNIMTIPEIIIVVIVALVLKSKYIDYSKNVHQTLDYTSGDFVYEIHRDNDVIKVSKNIQTSCEQVPCTLQNIKDYEIKFSKNQMTFIKLFFDFKFMFKSKTLALNETGMKTELGRRSVFAMIHNEPDFISMKNYKNYTVIDYEQMSTYINRGFHYDQTTKELFVAMGERPTSGYAIVVTSAFKKDSGLYFYVTEQTPENQENLLSLITHPMVKIQLGEAPSNEIHIYNIETGEEFVDLDNPQPVNQPQEPASANNQGVTGIIGEMPGSLYEKFK